MNFWKLLIWIAGTLMQASHALEFARPFGDFMVLPHGRAIPVWGRAEPGTEITVNFGGQSESARCDDKGQWHLMLAAEKPSAIGREMSVKTSDQRQVFKDVLVGEVWLCSGQSNMNFPLSRAVGGKAEAAKADEFPAIRIFNLAGAPTDGRAYDAATLARLNPKDHFSGTWHIASETSASSLSALAWWTAKEIHLKKGIPIGIVENAVGGSGAEAWLPREVLMSRPDYKPLLDDRWLDSPKIGAWARGRAKLNLGPHLDAMHPFRPGFLFESGVREWAGFPFAGVMWYQGETNAEIADEAWNERMIEDLVTGWRTALKQKDLPFFMIQLPRIGGNDPLRAHWPQFRKAQENAAKDLPGVSLIVTQDLGWDSPDVHPPDKLPVAERLAKAILK